MYNIAICDNENEIREHLCTLTTEIMNEKELPFSIHTFRNAEELECALNSDSHFDVVILDIELDGKTGLQLAAELRNKNNQISIIFISAYERYLKNGYSVQPVHFLIKPVKKEDLREAFLADLRIHHSPPQIALKAGNTTITLKANDIIYVEVMNHALYIHAGSCETTSHYSLTQMEKLLPSNIFCRCHNSYIVNFNYINKISRTELQLKNGVSVPVGRKYYEFFQKKFIEYMNS